MCKYLEFQIQIKWLATSRFNLHMALSIWNFLMSFEYCWKVRLASFLAFSSETVETVGITTCMHNNITKAAERDIGLVSKSLKEGRALTGRRERGRFLSPLLLPVWEEAHGICGWFWCLSATAISNGHRSTLSASGPWHRTSFLRALPVGFSRSPISVPHPVERKSALSGRKVFPSTKLLQNLVTVQAIA